MVLKAGITMSPTRVLNRLEKFWLLDALLVTPMIGTAQFLSRRFFASVAMKELRRLEEEVVVEEEVVKEEKEEPGGW
jgi:hypothetical protein